MIGIGFIVANWVGYGCQYIHSNAGWRLCLGLQLVPAFLLLVGIQFLPFSPVGLFLALAHPATVYADTKLAFRGGFWNRTGTTRPAMSSTCSMAPKRLRQRTRPNASSRTCRT